MKTDKRGSDRRGAAQKPVYVLHTAVFLVILILVIGGISVNLHTSAHPKQNTAEGTKILSEMNDVDVGAVNQKIRQLEDDELKAKKEADERSMREKFTDCLVLGDSITQGLYEYGVLDQANVQADRGTGVSNNSNGKLEEHIAKAKEMKPAVLFLAYGMNDIEMQNGDPAGFVKAYKKVLEDLKTSLPDTKIYVNSILPAAQSAVEERPAFAKIQKFNARLKKLCKKENITFIDNTNLVKEEYYASDGIHMSPSYYTEWVSHMAEAAGKKKKKEN